MNANILVIGGCGYIGSMLVPYLQAKGNKVDSVDLELFGNPGNIENRKVDFRLLVASDLRPYDVVILLAGQSSVRMSESDSQATFRNNIVGFVELVEQIDDQLLVYASSSSVYSGVGAQPVAETWDRFSVGNVYDLSKYLNDCWAGLSGKRTLGLRFGTVNGPSPNLRTDIMINKMTLTALRDGKVFVANPAVSRPVLSLSDLCASVYSLLVLHSHATSELYPMEKGRLTSTTHKIFNLASFNATVEEIGSSVAQHLGVPVERLPDSKTYDFSINTDLFCRVANFQFTGSIPTIVDSLVDFYNKNGLREQGR